MSLEQHNTNTVMCIITMLSQINILQKSEVSKLGAKTTPCCSTGATGKSRQIHVRTLVSFKKICSLFNKFLWFYEVYCVNILLTWYVPSSVLSHTAHQQQ